jgi:hypothetical protein
MFDLTPVLWDLLLMYLVLFAFWQVVKRLSDI